MPSKVSTFEDFISNFGLNRLNAADRNAEALRDTARAYEAAVRSYHNTVRGTPETYVDTVDVSTFDAFAFNYRNQDFIALHRGVGHIIGHTFLYILAHPLAFPNIGDTSAMGAPPALDSLHLDSHNLPPLPNPPRHTERIQLAALLYTFAANFLIAHEIAHIRFGHVRYTPAHSLGTYIAEAGARPWLTPDQAITFQALEMDADLWAASQGIDSITTILNNNPEVQRIVPSRSAAISYWLYAVYGFFRLLCDLPYDHSELTTADHPPPRLRQDHIIRTLVTRSRHGLTGVSDCEALQLSFGVAAQMEADIAAIKRIPATPTAFATGFDPAVEAHVQTLMDRWRILRPELEPLSYGDELAPAV